MLLTHVAPTRMWVRHASKDIEPGSNVYRRPAIPVECVYNFLTSFFQALKTLNPGSIAKVYTTEVNDEEHLRVFQTTNPPQCSSEYSCIHSGCLFCQAEENKFKELNLYPVLNRFKRQPTLPCSLSVSKSEPRGNLTRFLFSC